MGQFGEKSMELLNPADKESKHNRLLLFVFVLGGWTNVFMSYTLIKNNIDMLTYGVMMNPCSVLLLFFIEKFFYKYNYFDKRSCGYYLTIIVSVIPVALMFSVLISDQTNSRTMGFELVKFFFDMLIPSAIVPILCFICFVPDNRFKWYVKLYPFWLGLLIVMNNLLFFMRAV